MGNPRARLIVTLPRVCASDVIRTIDRLPTQSDESHAPSVIELEGAPLAVSFDADGTIWSGDVGIEAFTDLVRRREVLAVASEALRRQAEASGVAVVEGQNRQAEILLEAFAAGQLASRAAFTMMAWAFAGRTPDQMDEFANRFAMEAGLPERSYSEVAEIAVWCRRNGIKVLVVSASPEPIVRSALDRLAFSVDGLIAMRPLVSGGLLQPAVSEPAPYAAGKVAAIAQFAPNLKLIAAFGDSLSDLPMLSMARVPVAVRPHPALAAAREQCPGLVELCVAGPP